jgi:hypothetical protein
LDRLFFGALMKLTTIAHGEFDDISVNNHITKLIETCEQAARLITIRGSFDWIGMVPDTLAAPFRLRLNKDSLRENPGFKVIWDRDIKIEELPRRRQAQRSRVMNSEFIISESSTFSHCIPDS